MRPHRWQPTRLPRPWDSPGKNIGGGRHFLLQCTKVKIESEVSQSCWTLSDPMDWSPPGSSVHGILQAKEYWSGVSLPSPESRSVLSNSLLPRGILQARILRWVPFPSPGNRPNPGIKSWSPALWADSLPAEPQGKPKNTGVGSLSLLQQIFPTQESIWGLLHRRRILYQLSYEGRVIHFTPVMLSIKLYLKLPLPLLNFVCLQKISFPVLHFVWF